MNTIFRARTMLALGILGLASAASAHHRDFTFLRDWFLPYKGENEIELRTVWIPETGEFAQEFEYEYGFDKHFAIEPGIEFHKDPGDKLHFDACDVELRFNFGEFAYNTVLFALNVEYEHPQDTAEPDKGELKFIFSMYQKDGSDLSLNLNVGQELEGPREKESEILLGYVRQLSDHKVSAAHNYNLGIRGGFEFMHDFQEHHNSFGPTLVYRGNEHVNVLATYLFGLNDRDENLDQFKFIAEYEF